MIYLDYAATAPVPRAVADAMYEVLTERYGNPSSQYPFGAEMKKRVEDWRRDVAALLDCPAEGLHFTSCGTEGDNWALRAAVWQNRHVGNHIVTTAVEHSAVLECCKWLEREGCEVTYLAPDQNGSLTAEQVLEAVRPDTAAVSVMLVNNELGTVYPVADIARGLAARNPKTLLPFVIGSPVYFASPAGGAVSFMDRLFFSTLNIDKTMKVGAAVVSCRRGGNTATFDMLNKYFTMCGMPVASSQYWNMVHGGTPEEVLKDEEGMQTMRTLGRNMAFLMKSIRMGKEKLVLPQKEQTIFTSFHR